MLSLGEVISQSSIIIIQKFNFFNSLDLSTHPTQRQKDLETDLK